MKRNHVVLFIALCFVTFTVDCMNSSDNTNRNDVQPQDAYNCQKLMLEFSSFKQLSRKEKNLVFDTTLRKWLKVRSKKYLLEERRHYAQKHSIEQNDVSKTLAGLVCYGVSPNRVVVENVSRSQGYGVYPAYETRDYLCSLEYAVEIDDADLAFFLIEHNAWKNTNRLTWFASIKDRVFGESPEYTWTITRKKEDPLLMKVCSVKMAETLVPHIGLNYRFPQRKNIAHIIAENNNTYPNQLWEYYLNSNPRLVDEIDQNKNTPLHLLADNYPYEKNKKDSLLKTKLLVQRTKNINALNTEGQTALDKALKQFGSKEFGGLIKEYGGESAHSILISNAVQENDYEDILKNIEVRSWEENGH